MNYLHQFENDSSFREIHDELREVNSWVSPYYRPKPLSDLELGLGLTAFMHWTVVGKRSGPEFYQFANVTARKVAVGLISRLAENQIAVAGLKSAVPTFSPASELALALEKTSLRNFTWRDSTTRATIMAARGLAYAATCLIGGPLQFLEQYNLAEIAAAAHRLLRQHSDKDVADYLLSLAP
jgi:hypothetical protein